MPRIRRLEPISIEEGEGGGVDGAVFVERGDPGDRPRDDEAGEDRVGAVGVGAEQVEFHGAEDGGRRGGGQWRDDRCWGSRFFVRVLEVALGRLLMLFFKAVSSL